MIFEKIEFGKDCGVFNGSARSFTFRNLLASQKFGRTRAGKRIIYKEISMEREKSEKNAKGKFGKLRNIAKVLKEKEKNLMGNSLSKSRYVRAYTPIEMQNEPSNQSSIFRKKFRIPSKPYQYLPKPSAKNLNPKENSIVGWL